jgi:hypothetical protein
MTHNDDGPANGKRLLSYVDHSPTADTQPFS